MDYRRLPFGLITVLAKRERDSLPADVIGLRNPELGREYQIGGGVCIRWSHTADAGWPWPDWRLGGNDLFEVDLAEATLPVSQIASLLYERIEPGACRIAINLEQVTSQEEAARRVEAALSGFTIGKFPPPKRCDGFVHPGTATVHLRLSNDSEYPLSLCSLRIEDDWTLSPVRFTACRSCLKSYRTLGERLGWFDRREWLTSPLR